jgi:hypothetical protein
MADTGSHRSNSSDAALCLQSANAGEEAVHPAVTEAWLREFGRYLTDEFAQKLVEHCTDAKDLALEKLSERRNDAPSTVDRGGPERSGQDDVRATQAVERDHPASAVSES